MKSPSHLALLVALAPISFSQSALFTFNGDSPDDRFGTSVSGAGDVNGDGYGDLIVGAFNDDNNGQDSGSARVFSGVDGSVLYTFDGDSPGDTFGHAVSGAGDVNADGFDDLLIGARFDDNNGLSSGSARVLSGIDGSTLYTFYGDRPTDQFGYCVSAAGDVDGDTFADVIVGVTASFQNGLNSGYARVFSGATGAILYTFPGNSVDDGFGRSVGGAGDVNADGYSDVIVGAREQDDSGSAHVFSGLDGTSLYTFVGDSPADLFGGSVSGAGDVNGDGFDDMIVGAAFDDNNGSESGSARVFSGLDGSILYTFNGDSPGDRLGRSVWGGGDANGDSYADAFVGIYHDDSNGPNSGSARAFSGMDGSVLFTVDGDSPGDDFGYSVSGADDVNGDGFADMIVGALWDDNNGANSGSARVFSGCDALGTSYCTPAVRNSSGQPAVISACGSDLVGGGYFMLHATVLPPNQFGYFLAGQTQGFFNPPGSQGFICLSGNVGRYNQAASIIQGPTGSIQIDLTSIPVNPPQAVLPGDTWNFQCWFRDNNPGLTSNFTDGVSITFN